MQQWIVCVGCIYCMDDSHVHYSTECLSLFCRINSFNLFSMNTCIQSLVWGHASNDRKNSDNMSYYTRFKWLSHKSHHCEESDAFEFLSVVANHWFVCLVLLCIPVRIESSEIAAETVVPSCAMRWAWCKSPLWLSTHLFSALNLMLKLLAYTLGWLEMNSKFYKFL